MPTDEQIFPRVLGPILLGLVACTGVFARGLVNGTYAFLVLWGVIYLLTAKKNWWRPTPPLPKLYCWGLGLYFVTILLTTLTGSDLGQGFYHVANVAYLLAGLALAWLVLSQWPPVIRYLVPLYALGLIVAGVMTFKQANFGLNCVRAKASLGIIELGAVLSQVTPLLVGAAAVAYKLKEKRRLVFFLVALLVSLVAHVHSCSRIAILATPVLTIMVLWGLRNCFGAMAKVAIVLTLALAAVIILSNDMIVSRFQEMTVDKGNYNNDLRLNYWKHGVKVFKEHPLLGVGPRAIPHAPPVIPPPDLVAAVRLLPPPPKYCHAHQLFLTTLAESGVVGLLGFLALHLAPIILLWPYRRVADLNKLYWVWGAFAVAGQLFLNGLTDYVFTLRPLMYIYWVVTGVALWVTRYGGEEVGQAGAAVKNAG
ncbi:MAG: O-antigen ligase family protein [Deltaproteobacteria bacterium]|jgi:O-antigen ligase|nr:O-antigen ligase family protein [Deltaproteobacteria bacterium]